jgi:hypothetical protein
MLLNKNTVHNKKPAVLLFCNLSPVVFTLPNHCINNFLERLGIRRRHVFNYT